MKKLLIYFAIMFLMFGCASSDDSGGDEKPNHVFDYTLTSNAGNFSINDRVIYATAPCSNDDCSSQGTFSHEYEIVVTIADQVDISYTQNKTGKYFLTIYVDKDDTSTLSNGDQVWVKNGSVCGAVLNYTDSDTLDDTDYAWETLSTDIGCDGNITFAGTTQSWSVGSSVSSLISLPNKK